MQHLLKESLTEIRGRIDAASIMSLFLDFDGTLTPLIRNPERVRLNTPTRNVLLDILGSRTIALHVISGRSLDDVAARVGVDGITYAGNHGMEIMGRYVRFVDPIALSARNDLLDLTDQLRGALQPFRGVQIEFKRLTATVHYGKTAETEIPAVREIVDDLAEVYSPSLRLRSGVDSVDILPSTSWNKGSAVNWINECCGIPPQYSIYIGDDSTDEDAFKALPEGITIRVGDTPTSAAMFLLNDPVEVLAFLQWIAYRRN